MLRIEGDFICYLLQICGIGKPLPGEKLLGAFMPLYGNKAGWQDAGKEFPIEIFIGAIQTGIG